MRKPLFSPRRYLQTHPDQVVPPTAGKGRREWLMARGLCHYQCFDLSQLSPLQREAALQLKIRQWSPFSDTADYTAWHKGKAQVWIWDRAQQQQAQQTQALKPLPVLPESALRPPGNDGLHWVQTADGIEAQIWQKGVLRSSRWWASLPDEATWQRFLRSNGQSYQSLPEQLPAAVLLPKPWAKAQNRWHTLSLLWRQERLWVTLGLAVLLGVFVWEWLPITRWQEKIAALDNQIEQLSLDAEPVLTARTKVLAQKQELEALQALDIYPDQLKLLYEVAAKLPKDAILQEWQYEAGELKIKIQAESIDPREYVSLLQSIPLFQEVKPDTSKAGEIMLSMQVLPNKEF